MKHSAAKKAGPQHTAPQQGHTTTELHHHSDDLHIVILNAMSIQTQSIHTALL